MADAPKKPEGRVISGPNQNIFANPQGGRNSYGALILNALTGMTTEELGKQLVQKGIDPSEAQRLQKEIAEGGEVSATLLDSEDQFFRDYLRIHAGPSVLAPPIAPERLERLVSENNALEPCIAAMVTNISCTGYRIMPKRLSESDITEELDQQRDYINEFLEEVYPGKSFLTTRKQLRRDLHTTGNSYMVIERNALGEIAFIRRAPAKSMRMIKLDDPVEVQVRMRRNGEEVEITTMRAERRYVQKIGTKFVYYKQYGAQRDLNRTTGEWAEPGSLAANQRAHEVIHDKDIEDVKSPYGMPRWITQLPSVLGSRMAEEHNLAYFQSGGLPPVMIFVAGGLVSENVAKSINDYLSGGAKDKQRSVAVEIPSSGDLVNEKPAVVQVERFGSQDADSTFEVYLDKNEQRIRRAFRLPGIFLGQADAYNYATARASYVVAEAQVFAPERDEDDERYNMTIMREIDPTGEWCFVSHPLSVQDVDLQLRGLQMLSAVRGVAVKDFVDEVARVSGVEVSVAEEYETEIIGEGVFSSPLGEQPEDDEDDERTDAEQEAGDDSQAIAASVRMQANVLAARIARAVRDYDDLEDDESLETLLSLREDYDGLPDEARNIVNSALTPVMFSSPFLNSAVMADVAEGYAMAAFQAASRRITKESA